MTRNSSIYDKYTSSADRDDIIAGRSSVAFAFRGCSFSLYKTWFLYIRPGDDYPVNFLSQYFSSSETGIADAISSFK